MSQALTSESSRQVGPHVLKREGPITRVTMGGVISYEHMLQFLEEYQAMIDEQGFALIMMEMGTGGEMGMQARRVASEWGSKRSHRVRSAVVGASFFLRSGIELLSRAAKLMTGNGLKVTFVQTQEEARAWLLAQVPELQQTQKEANQ